MSTHNICFLGEIRKIFTLYPYDLLSVNFTTGIHVKQTTEIPNTVPLWYGQHHVEIAF